MGKNTGNKQQQQQAKNQQDTEVKQDVELKQETTIAESTQVTEGTDTKVETGAGQDSAGEEGSDEAAKVVADYTPEAILDRLNCKLPAAKQIATQLSTLALNSESNELEVHKVMYHHIIKIFYSINSVNAHEEFPVLIAALVEFLAEESANPETKLRHSNIRRFFCGVQNEYTRGLEGLFRLAPRATRNRIIEKANIDMFLEVYKEDARQFFVPSIQL